MQEQQQAGTYLHSILSTTSLSGCSFVSFFFSPLSRSYFVAHPLWCLLAIFPALNLLAFWFFTFKQWPTGKKAS